MSLISSGGSCSSADMATTHLPRARANPASSALTWPKFLESFTTRMVLGSALCSAINSLRDASPDPSSTKTASNVSLGFFSITSRRMDSIAGARELSL